MDEPKRSFQILSDTMGPIRTGQHNPAYTESDDDEDSDHDDSKEGQDNRGDDIRASTASNFDRRLLSDTMGPRKAIAHFGTTDSTGDTPTSSTRSSELELSEAEKRGQNSSFRDPTFQKPRTSTGHSSDNQVGVASTSNVQLYAFRGDEVNRNTPDSTASSSKRFFMGQNGEQKNFYAPTNSINMSNHNSNGYKSTTSGPYGKSMRDRVKFNTAEVAANHYESVSPGQQNTLETRYTYSVKSQKDMDEYDNPKAKPCLPKCAFLGFVVLLLITGIVLLVYFNKETGPGASKGNLIPNQKPEMKRDECPVARVRLQEQIIFNCIVEVPFVLRPGTIRLVPPAYVNGGQPLDIKVVNQLNMTAPWSATYGGVGRNILDISGPLTSCSSNGTYLIEFLDDRERSIYNTSVQIQVISEILKVNVSLTQAESSTESNQTDYTVACSTNSGCEQSFVDFFADIDKEEQYLRGVNFSCLITYNDYDGYSVACTGTIPENLMSQFGRITCRPRSRLLDKEEVKDLEETLELPECDIKEHCGYKCTPEGHYFVVNTGRCDIFHRCKDGNILQTSFCAPGTFFDPTKCSCDHTTELQWCQDNGAVKPNQDISASTCKAPDDEV